MSETSRPNTFFSGTVGPMGDRPGPNSAIARIGMYLLGVILFPFALIFYAIWLALFTYARLPWWIPIASGGTLLVGGIVSGNVSLGAVEFYGKGYVNFFESIFVHHNNFGVAFGQNIGQILVGQLWLGLLISTLLAGLVCAFKYARRPAWQEKFIKPGPVLKRREKKTAKEIARGIKSPTDGVTLGLSHDRRDPRYAGGDPGTKYGQRVVISNDELAAHTFIVGGSGSGKALDVETPIPTPNGFVRMGDIQVGDTVYGSNGKPVKVLAAQETYNDHKVYEVVFSDGSKIKADAEHIWSVKTIASRKALNCQVLQERKVLTGANMTHETLSPVVSYNNVYVSDMVNLTTEQIAETLANKDGKPQYSVPVVSRPVQFPIRENLPLSPYLMGLLLGNDGPTNTSVFATPDTGLLQAWLDGGYSYKQTKTKNDYYIVGLRSTLRKVNVWENKHIPNDYLFASEDQRRALLAGLLDADGYHEGGANVSLATKLPQMADQIFQLVASLGYRPTKTFRSVNWPDSRKLGLHYVITFQALDDVFQLKRKAVAHKLARVTDSGNTSRHSERYIVEVREIESIPVRCIGVDSEDHLFLAGHSFIPTHNTSSMLMGIRDAIRMGHGVIMIDCKASPKVTDPIAEWAGRYGRDFYHWSIQDKGLPYEGPADSPAYYDPISRGDASRRKDLLIGSQRWDVEYYKEIISNYLQTVFRVIDLVPEPETDTFTDVSNLLSPGILIRRATYISAEDHPDLPPTLQMIANLDSLAMSGINGMYSRLHTLTSSTAGQWLRKDPEGKNDINLRRVADEGQVVVFSLNGDLYEATASLIAGLVIQDLKTLSSELRDEGAVNPLHVYIDEFSAVDTSNLLGLLARAREAKMPCMLATQALADLARKDPTFPSQVLSIVSNFMIHRANGEDDARVYAGLSGVTRKVTERMSIEESSGIFGTMGAATSMGNGYIEEREGYRVNVGDFQSLKLGEVILIVKSPSERYINFVKVVLEDSNFPDAMRDKAVEVKPHVRRIRVEGNERVTYPHPQKVRDGVVKNPYASKEAKARAENILAPLMEAPDAVGMPISAQTRGPSRPKRPNSKSQGVGVQAGAPLPLPQSSSTPKQEPVERLGTPTTVITPPIVTPPAVTPPRVMRRPSLEKPMGPSPEEWNGIP